MQHDHDFDDDAIRAELRRMVERLRSELHKTAEEAVAEVERESRAFPEGTDEFRAEFRKKFSESQDLADSRFNAMLAFIDRR